jgi:hypothetical protein
MIAFKEWMPDDRDNMVKISLNLTDKQFEAYQEILTGNKKVPNTLLEEIEKAQEAMPKTNYGEISAWAIGRWVKNNIKE